MKHLLCMAMSVFCSTRFFITPMRSLKDCCHEGHLLLKLLDLGLELDDFLGRAPEAGQCRP